MKKLVALPLLILTLLAGCGGGSEKDRAARDVRNRGFRADQKIDLAGAMTIEVPRGFRLKAEPDPLPAGETPHARFFLTLGAYTDAGVSKKSGLLTVRAFPRENFEELSKLYPFSEKVPSTTGFWINVRTYSPVFVAYRRVGPPSEFTGFVALDYHRGFAVELAALKDLYTSDQAIGIVTAAIKSIEVKQPAFDQVLTRVRPEFAATVAFKQKNRADVETRIGPIPKESDETATTPAGDVLGTCDIESDELPVAMRLAQLSAADPETEAKRYTLDQKRHRELTMEPEPAKKDPDGESVGLICFRNAGGELQTVRLEPGEQTRYAFSNDWGKAFQEKILAGTPAGSIVFWRFRVLNLRRNPQTVVAWITDCERYRKAARDGSPIWKPKVAAK